MLVHCKACGATYDGNAQCCMELDHDWIPETPEEEEEIQKWREESVKEMLKIEEEICKRMRDDEVQREK